MNTGDIQRFLKDNDIDGWLLSDFHGRNTIAVRMLGIEGIISRRSFYHIPAEGEPRGLVHAVERDKLAGLPGRIDVYSGYRTLEAWLADVLSEGSRVAMEYSPRGRLPYVALVDAGTVEYIRSLGVKIVSSADLVARFEARLTPEQLDLHREAARYIMGVKDEAFEFIAGSLRQDRHPTEHQVVQFILSRFESNGMVTEYPPNCSVGANAGNPHYEPGESHSQAVTPGQLVLIDLWAKFDVPEGIYGDITWMAFAGPKPDIPPRYAEIFDVIVRARDAALGHASEQAAVGPVRGAEVDDVCRAVVEKAGFGKYFTHRTGHSIGTEVHGNGPNIDNLETEDARLLQPGHLFSIEPGIYLDDCGFRTEIDAYITEGGCETACLPLQTEIVPLG